MNMQEALEWAADYADRSKLFEPIANQRGYADGWKPPTPAEKARVITELAKEACGPASGSGERDWKLLGGERDRLKTFIHNVRNDVDGPSYELITGIYENIEDLVKRNGG